MTHYSIVRGRRGRGPRSKAAKSRKRAISQQALAARALSRTPDSTAENRHTRVPSTGPVPAIRTVEDVMREIGQPSTAIDPRLYRPAADTRRTAA